MPNNSLQRTRPRALADARPLRARCCSGVGRRQDMVKVTEYFLIGGGLIFAVLGLLHGIYAILDIYHPRRFAPMDPSLIDQMASSGLRIARGRTNMWDTWLGFNLSHSLGLMVFGSVCVYAGVFLRSLALPKAGLLIPVLVGIVYFLLAIRFWFRVPALGAAIGTVFLFVAWVLS